MALWCHNGFKGGSFESRTEKDVSIGSPERSVYEIYGKENCEHTGNMYIYHSKGGNEMLQFFIEDGYIAKIQISASII